MHKKYFIFSLASICLLVGNCTSASATKPNRVAIASVSTTKSSSTIVVRTNGKSIAIAFACSKLPSATSAEPQTKAVPIIKTTTQQPIMQEYDLEQVLPLLDDTSREQTILADKKDITDKKVRFLKEVDVLGDGNCFFRAVSRVLMGSEEYHQILRNKTANYILQDEESGFEVALREELSKEVKTLGRYSEELEMKALASSENICLIVHDYRDGGKLCDRVFGDTTHEKVHIKFVPNEQDPWGPGHFKALIPR